MSSKIQKYLLPNVPYLFILWVALKLGMAYRIADGTDIGAKIVGMSDTIAPTFQNAAPGLNGFDWLFGITCACLLRLAVYFKAKNVKKFRRDEEYGSARWGA